MESRRKEYETERRRAREDSERSLIDMADQYKQKLIVEYQRFESLDEQYKTLKKSYSRKLATMENQKQVEVGKIRAEHQEKLQQKEKEVC